MERTTITKWVGVATLLGSISMHAQAAEKIREIEFAGYATVGQEQLFVLYDNEAKSPSPWIKIGQGWRGYTVLSFDRSAEKLILRSGKSDLALKLREAKTKEAVLLPGLARGSYTLVDGTVVYSADAQLKLGRGFLISSPSGLMVSDDKQTVVGGDLTIETASGKMMAQDATVDVSKGVIKAKKISISVPQKKEPNKAPEPTPTSVTPPAAQESRRP